jgi:hypothetical protein
MNEADIYKDVSRRLFDMMTEKFKGTFKMFYLGAPSFMPPEDALPCMIIYKTGNSVTVDATGLDAMTETIMISLIYSEKQDFNSPESQYQNTTLRKMHNLVEARDPATLEWKTGTIMEAIRTNFTLDDSTLGNKAAVNYNVTPIPEAPTLLEAVITLTINSLVQVPSRT